VKRFFEVDLLRGLAVIAMIAFHALFDLNFFAGHSFALGKGPLLLLGRSASVSFVFLAGLSLTLSYNRAKNQKRGFPLFKKYLYRGLKIFSLGLAITALTMFFFPGQFIAFGALHLIGLSIILSFPFLNKKYLNLGLGLAITAAGLFLAQFSFPFSWLLWLGLKPIAFQSFDYFPVLPWLGIILIGIFAGNSLYPKGKRRIQMPEAQDNPAVSLLSFIGRHSLVIYFLHQPVLIALILLLA